MSTWQRRSWRRQNSERAEPANRGTVSVAGDACRPSTGL
jgi:hypothetical protein